MNGWKAGEREQKQSIRISILMGANNTTEKSTPKLLDRLCSAANYQSTEVGTLREAEKHESSVPQGVLVVTALAETISFYIVTDVCSNAKRWLWLYDIMPNVARISEETIDTHFYKQGGFTRTLI